MHAQCNQTQIQRCIQSATIKQGSNKKIKKQKKTNCPGEIEEDSNKKLGFLKFTPSVTSPKGEFHNKMSKFIKVKKTKTKLWSLP